MAFYESINFILDPVLSPFISLGHFWAVFLISLIIALIITLVYKWVTDQELMKTLKEDIKALQQEMKKLRDNPSKMMEVQKKAMEKNMKYMMQSMKPTLITFIPIIVIFGWMNSYYKAMGNPDVLFGLSWLWTYIIFSIVMSIALRKLLKVH